ncbi:DNA-binding domain protein [Vibrio phage 1.226.O._10N.261.48.E5]|nr:DNA-binding domain protein [Vibrio phage 1.226.O._10N.261.48.E5]
MIGVGDICSSNSFGDFVVVSKSGKHCLIRFIDTGTDVFATSDNAENGRVKDRNRPSVKGVGFIGYGRHKSTDPAYIVWSNMLSRCYCEKNKSYKDYGLRGVVVCDEWHSFQSFADWYCIQASENPDIERPEIDKDIIGRDMKEYSPKYCKLVERSENMAESHRSRVCRSATGYRGVYISHGKYQARVTVSGKRISVGTYDTAKDAADGIVNYLQKQQ